MSQAVALPQKHRLPMPANAGVTDEQWRLLVDTIWPGAKAAESVVMALSYCRVRNLDPFKRPVHIVSQYNSVLKKQVETLWPGIGELQTTAARTGAWAGMDPPVWGEDVTETFKGADYDGNETSVTVVYPSWCSVTVYRMIGGVRCAFSEPVYWREAYASVGRSPMPNQMWQKRTRGQLHKVAKAAALRAAFPEEVSEYTAEEMEGKTTQAGGVVIDHEPEREPPAAPPPPVPHQAVAKVMAEAGSPADTVMDRLTRCETYEQVARLQTAWQAVVAKAEEAGRPIDRVTLYEVGRALQIRAGELPGAPAPSAPPPPPPPARPSFSASLVDAYGEAGEAPYTDPATFLAAYQAALDGDDSTDAAAIEHFNADAVEAARGMLGAGPSAPPAADDPIAIGLARELRDQFAGCATGNDVRLLSDNNAIRSLMNRLRSLSPALADQVSDEVAARIGGSRR